MKSTEQEREMKQFDSGVVPAVISCVAGVVGLLMIAASPWLLLASNAPASAAEQPAFQAAKAFPSVAVTRPILFRTGG